MLAWRLGSGSSRAAYVRAVTDPSARRDSPVRGDSGPELIATVVRGWLSELGVATQFIEPGLPWENGYIESINGKLDNELLNGEFSYTLMKGQILVAKWRRLHNGLRPYSSLRRRPPAPETIAWPGFSLKDFAPPALTYGTALALS